MITEPDASARIAIRRRAAEIVEARWAHFDNPRIPRKPYPVWVVYPVVFHFEPRSGARDAWLRLEDELLRRAEELGAYPYGYNMVAFHDLPELIQVEKALLLWWRLEQRFAGSNGIEVSMSTICRADRGEVICDPTTYRGTAQWEEALRCQVGFLKMAGDLNGPLFLPLSFCDRSLTQNYLAADRVLYEMTGRYVSDDKLIQLIQRVNQATDHPSKRGNIIPTGLPSLNRPIFHREGYQAIA
jgi:hypothetical protein